MKRLVGQVLTSTALDSQGDRLTREQLETFLSQMPRRWVMNQHHDMSLPPIAVAENPRLVVLKNCEHAIVADIDVIDEIAFEDIGGVSIAYTNPPDRGGGVFEEPGAQLLYDPLQFSREEVEAVTLADAEHRIECIERRQKTGLEIAAIAVLSVIATQFLGGFFGEAGKDCWRLFKSKLAALLRKKHQSGINAKIQLHFPVAQGECSYLVIVDLQEHELERIGSSHSLMSLLEFVGSKVGSSSVERIAVSPSEEPNTWLLIHFVDNEGRVVTTG
jgi:hypothetical protein